MTTKISFPSPKFGHLACILILIISGCKNQNNIKSKGHTISSPDGVESYSINVLFKQGNRKQAVLIIDNNASPKTVPWEMKADGSVQVQNKIIEWSDGVLLYIENGGPLIMTNSEDARLLDKLIHRQVEFKDIIEINKKFGK